MDIEIYDMLEKTEMDVAGIDDDSKHLIEALNLDGQRELLNPDKTTIRPYNNITKDQQFICSVLFPECTSLNKYNAGPIPYRILKEAAAAKEHCGYLYILHESSIQVKDPVLVGSSDEIYGNKISHDYQWRKISLIARWGTALDSWETLYEKAVKLFNMTSLNSFRSLKEQVEIAISLLEQGVRPTNSQFDFEAISKAMPYSA
jgi:hypothetical protein